MLTLLLTTTAIGLPAGPSSALNTWRTSRLTRWSRSLDRRFDAEFRYRGKPRPDLRYRTQILVLDSDGCRARICEALLDKLCEAVDADVDTAASFLGATSPAPPSLLQANDALQLSRLPLVAAARQLRPVDLQISSRWDVVICVDSSLCERVRALARATNAVHSAGGSLEAADGWAGEGGDLLRCWGSDPSGDGTDASVLCLSDFLATAVPAYDCGRLPDALRSLVAPMYDAGDTDASGQVDRALVDMPAALDETAGEEAWDDLYGAAAACCCGLVSYLTAAMREHATRHFWRDLYDTFGRPPDAARGLCWEQARGELRAEHGVPGGLSDEEQRGLYESVAPPADRESPAKSQQAWVDVSDLGITMDDLSSPFGGIGQGCA